MSDRPIDPRRCARCVMIGGLHTPMCPNHPFRSGRHRRPNDDNPGHRVVFGDLVPIEQYRNGGEGRHHRSPRFDPNNIADLARFLSPGYTTTTETEQ